MKRDHLIALLVGMVWMSIGIGLRSRQHTYDALMFTYALADGGFHSSIWRPHNLFYLPGALVLHRIGGGIWGDPFLSGQIWSSLWAGVALALGWLLFRRFLSISQAALMLCLYATSCAVLAMSTLVEVYTTSLAAVSALLLAVLRRKPHWPVVGLLWGFAVVCHLTNVLLAVPLFLHAIQRRSIRSFLLMSVWGAMPTLALYLTIAFAMVGVDGAEGFQRWVISYAANTGEFGRWGWATVRDGLLGSKRALVEGRALGLMLFHVLASGLAVWVMARMVRRWSVILPLAGFLVVYTVFFCWWEPLNIEFRLVPLLPYWLLMGLALRSLRERNWRIMFTVALYLALAVQVWLNGAGMVRRLNPTGDYWTQAALRLRPKIEPADLVVGFNDPTIFALRIFNDHRNIASIDMAAGAEIPSLANARRVLLPWMEATRAAGGRVLLLPEALHPSDPQIGRLRITREEYSLFLDEIQPWLVVEP
jgi:hypothetical protein